MRMNEEHWIDVTFSDLKGLFLRHFTRIRKVFLFSALACMLFLFFREPQYFAESTFKQTVPRQEIGMGLKEAYQQLFSLSSENAAASIMQSDIVLKSAVEVLGIQANCDPDGLFLTGIKRLRDRFVLECGGKLSDPDRFAFRNVSYQGEEPLQMNLKLDGSLYQLYDKKGELLGEAEIGLPVSFAEGKLILSTIPKSAKASTLYPLTISSWESSVSQVRKKIKIAPLKQDKSILKLQFSSRDRMFASEFLNELMHSYQKYLKAENDETCQEQLAYLRQRERELTGHYDEALIEHVEYLQQSLSKNGFIEFAQEIETLSQPKKTYTSQLFDVDLALQRLEVDLSGEKRREPYEMTSHLALEIEETEKQLQEAEKTIVSLENKQELPAADPLLAGLREIAAHHRQKKKILEENFTLQQGESHDFSGLNLKTAQELLVEYTRLRDGLQAQVRELVFLRDQLSYPDFEVSSLGGAINDSVTSDLIKKASDLALQLKDDENRSDREQARLQEILKTQKNFLSQYLFQSIELKKLRAKLLADKIDALRRTTTSLLQEEKALLIGKIQELNHQMGDVPEKWRRESLLLLKRELGSEMLQGISQLAEAKNLGQHIFQVNSRPLDIAYPPKTPQAHKMLIVSFLVGLLAVAVYYFMILARQMLRGLPVTEESLKLSGFPVSGSLSSQGDHLETLRNAAEFLLSLSQKNIVAACIGGKNPNYSSSLAEILTLRGHRVLIIDCLFERADSPGLWPYLENRTGELPLRRELRWDRLSSGIATRHGAELVGSQSFSQFLSEIKQKYDIVLLYSGSQMQSAEARSFLSISDAFLITVQQETKADLLPYMNKKPCTFIPFKETFT